MNCAGRISRGFFFTFLLVDDVEPHGLQVLHHHDALLDVGEEGLGRAQLGFQLLQPGDDVGVHHRLGLEDVALEDQCLLFSSTILNLSKKNCFFY